MRRLAALAGVPLAFRAAGPAGRAGDELGRRGAGEAVLPGERPGKAR